MHVVLPHEVSAPQRESLALCDVAEDDARAQRIDGFGVSLVAPADLRTGVGTDYLSPCVFSLSCGYSRPIRYCHKSCQNYIDLVYARCDGICLPTNFYYDLAQQLTGCWEKVTDSMRIQVCSQGQRAVPVNRLLCTLPKLTLRASTSLELAGSLDNWTGLLRQ